MGVSLSLLQLRKTHPHAERPYLLPYASVVATLAALGSLFILIAMVIPKSPVFLVWPLEWSILVPLCIAGILFWIFGKKQRLKIDENELRKVDVGITRLRQKIETVTKKPQFIKTIRSKGYMLVCREI